MQLYQWLSLTILNLAKFLMSLTEIAEELGTVTVGDFDSARYANIGAVVQCLIRPLTGRPTLVNSHYHLRQNFFDVRYILASSCRRSSCFTSSDRA